MVPIDSLERSTAGLHFEQVEADGAGFRAFGADAVPDCFLVSSGTRLFNSTLAFLFWGMPFGFGERLQRIPPSHLTNSYPRRERLRCGVAVAKRGARRSRRSAELLLGGEQDVLIKGIGRDGDFDPFPAARDDREHCFRGIRYRHIVPKLGRDHCRRNARVLT
jgi:hypothetical protein